MKVEIDIWHEAEYRALSVFSLALAEAHKERRKDKSDVPEDTSDDMTKTDAAEATITNTPRAGETTNQTAARERGKPAPGRARRTKEEIAEDEAADAAQQKYQAEGERLKAGLGGIENAQGQGISTGENRVSPEDSADDQAQDAADEAAEAGQSATYTVDDLRKELTAYANKFGMEQIQADGPGLFVAALGNPPAGEDAWKISLVPADKMAAAVKAWQTATASDKPIGPVV